MSQVESRTCTDYMPVTGNTSRNRSNPYRPLYTCVQTAYARVARLTQATKGGCYSTLSTPPRSAPAVYNYLRQCSNMLIINWWRPLQYHHRQQPVKLCAKENYVGPKNEASTCTVKKKRLFWLNLVTSCIVWPHAELNPSSSLFIYREGEGGRRK